MMMPTIAWLAVVSPVLQIILLISAIIALFHVTVALKVYIRKNR